MVQPEILITEQAAQDLILKPLRDRSGLSVTKFSAGEYLIGSASHCSYQLTCDGIAPEHCKLKFDGKKATVQAIDSRTWINDTPVAESSVRKGDRLSVGPINFHLDFIEAVEESSQPSASNQDDESLLSSDQVLQYLQRAISRGQIEPSALLQLNPGASSSTSPAVDQAVDELSQAIHQTREQSAELQQEDTVSDVPNDAQQESPAKSTEKDEAKQDKIKEEQESLQQEIKQLQEQFADQEQEQKNRELLLSEKESEITELKDSLAFSEKEWQESLSAKMHSERELHEEEQALLFQQVDFNRQIKSLEEDLAAFNEQKETQEQKRTQLEEQILDAQKTVQEKEEQFQQEKAAWNDREQQLNKESDNSQQREQQQLSEKSELEQQLKTFEQEAAASIEQKETLEQQILDAQQQLQEKEEIFQQEKIAWQGREQQLNEESENFQQREQQQLSEKSELEDQLKTSEQKAAASIEQKETQEQQRTQLEEQILDAQKTVQEKEVQHRQEKTVWDEREQQLNEETETFQQREQELVTLHEQAEEAHVAAVEELTCVQETLAQEQNRSESLQQDLDQLQSQTQQQASDKEVQVVELEKACEAKLLKIAAEKEYIEAVREDVELEKEAFSQAQKDLREVREQAVCDMQNLQQQLDDLDQQRIEFELTRDAILQNDATLQDESLFNSEQKTELPDDDLGTGNSEESILSDDISVDSERETVGDLKADRTVEANDEEATETLDKEFPENEEPHCNDEPHEVEKNPIDDVDELHDELVRMFGIEASQPETVSSEMPEEDTPVVPEDSLLQEIPAENERNEQTVVSENDDHPEEFEAEPSELTAAINELESAEDSMRIPAQSEEPDETESAAENANDPDSISAYMKNLFARTGSKQDYSELEIAQTATRKEQLSEPEQSLQSTSVSQDSAELSEQLPVAPVKEISGSPITAVDRKSMALEIASLRDIANQTAHNALSTHAGKQLRVRVLINSILTVATGVASAILLTAPLWGAHAYQDYGMMSILLCIVSSIELFRANMMLVRLKSGVGSFSDEASEYDHRSEQE